MPKPVRLRIAGDRHASDDQLRCQGQQFEAHLGIERAIQLGVFGGEVLPLMDRGHGLRLDTSLRQCARLESACADHDSVSQRACRPGPCAAQADAD